MSTVIYNSGSLKIKADTDAGKAKEAVEQALKNAGIQIFQEKYSSCYIDPNDAGELFVNFEEYCDCEIEEMLKKVCEELAPQGIALDGSLSYYGDNEGTIYVDDGKVSYLDIADRWRAEATDDEIISVLKERGYNVSKANAFRDFGNGVVELDPELQGDLIDIFEDFLDEKGVKIPNPERDAEDDENAANIYGDDYDKLGNELLSTLSAWFTIRR